MIVKVLVELDIPDAISGTRPFTDTDLKHLAGYVEDTIKLAINDRESLYSIGNERRWTLAKRIKGVHVSAVIGL